MYRVLNFIFSLLRFPPRLTQFTELVFPDETNLMDDDAVILKAEENIVKQASRKSVIQLAESTINERIERQATELHKVKTSLSYLLKVLKSKGSQPVLSPTPGSRPSSRRPSRAPTPTPARPSTPKA